MYLNNELNNKNRQAQTRYIQNGAYLRLKNLQIGYTIPKNLLMKLKLSRLRLYFSGDNLLTFTGKFPSSLDPETANIGGWGKGKAMSPQTMISFGVDVEF